MSPRIYLLNRCLPKEFIVNEIVLHWEKEAFQMLREHWKWSQSFEEGAYIIPV